MSGSLGEREMSWEMRNEKMRNAVGVSAGFSSSPKLS